MANFLYRNALRWAALGLAFGLTACGDRGVPSASEVSQPDEDRVAAVFQGDAGEVSVRDAALVWAFANLPEGARSPERLARAAEALLRSTHSVSAPEPSLDTSNVDFALPLDRVDTNDIAVAVAAVQLDDPTKAELAAAASLLLPVLLEAKDIRVVPGGGLPGEVGQADGGRGSYLTASVSGRRCVRASIAYLVGWAVWMRCVCRSESSRFAPIRRHPSGERCG